MQQSFAKWWRPAPVWLGLSVNAQSMTLVEWRSTRLAQAPEPRWVQQAWAPGEKQDAHVWSDPVQLGTAVRALWQRAGMRCRRLAMGLPADRVVQQTLQVEADLPAREVRAQVNWRASQALDLAWDDVSIDYRIENPDDEGAASAAQSGQTLTKTLTVNWLACPMALVQAAQQMSQSAKLHLRFLGVEPAHLPVLKDLPMGDPALSPQRQLACEMARQGSIA